MRFRKQQSKPWHALELDAIYEALGATASGLTESEAQARLDSYGPNELPRQKPPAAWLIFLRQFQSPLIYILGIAALVSFAIGNLKDAVFIGAVLLLNSSIGAFQEWRAQGSAQALQKLLKTRAAVERDGEVSELAAENVVPGDVVWVESGNRAPADLRLVNAQGLEVDESLLTGESLPVLKDAAWTGPEGAPLGDRVNCLFAGSIVTRGRAKGVAVATGMATNVGQLARDVMSSRGGAPPLLTRMRRFTHVVALVIVVGAAGMGGMGLVMGRYELADMFLFSVAIVVAAIPEGLPVAMTVALSIATTRMAKRGVIVRRLTAVEGLGSCTFIATDKTGTLTCNELTVRQLRLADGTRFDVTGEGFAPVGEISQTSSDTEYCEARGGNPGLQRLVRTAVLCNEADLHRRDPNAHPHKHAKDNEDGGAWTWRGDAVDVALLSLGIKLGWLREKALDDFPLVNQIPFEPEHQYAATYHTVDSQTMVFVKGAPERVLGMCTHPDDAEAWRKSQLADAEDMAAQGFRVLALAEGNIHEHLSPTEFPPTPSGLAFLGFAGMIDPLRPGAREAIQACHDAGIAVSMVTGDHRVTALAIARELGLADDEDQVLTGEALKHKSPEALADTIEHTRVFARVEPRQKLEIVQAARKAGHFVAVTGDGANDAPALRDANIGVAMGQAGTDVAREAAELVISDDNFSTIVAGIEEGRIAYDNIRKVIYFLISTGASALLLMAFAVIMQTPLPLLPVQILWLNLVTTGIQDVALAFEPGEGDSLRRKPRPPGEPVFDRLMIERTVVAAIVIAGVGFALFYWMLANGSSEEEARNILLLLIVLMMTVHIGNCRSETKSALTLSPFRSPILLIGTVVALVVHIGALYLPIGHTILNTGPVSLREWLLLLSLAFLIFPAIELHKWVWRIRHRPA